MNRLTQAARLAALACSLVLSAAAAVAQSPERVPGSVTHQIWLCKNAEEVKFR